MGAVLKKGKALAPDRFPQPSREVTEAWTEALGSTIESLPFEQMWAEAVLLWATHIVGERMITPKDLRAAVFTIRDRWESDPSRKGLLEQRREQLRVERDMQLEAGTFGAVRGYGSKPALDAPVPPAEGRGGAPRRLGGFNPLDGLTGR